MRSLYILKKKCKSLNISLTKADGSSKLTGDMYYNFFALMMFITSLLFLFVVKYYKEQSYLHEEK